MTNSNNLNNSLLQLLLNPTLSNNKKSFKKLLLIKSKKKLPRDPLILPSDQNLSITIINNNINLFTLSWLTLKSSVLTLIPTSISTSLSRLKLKLFKSNLKNLMTMMKKKSSKRLLSETKALKNLTLPSVLKPPLELVMKKPSHVKFFEFSSISNPYFR